MKTTADLRTFSRSWLVFRFVLLWTSAASVSPAKGEDGDWAASPRVLLKATSAAWLDAGIKGELLTRHARLLPDGFPAEQKKLLAAALQNPQSGDDGALQKLLAGFPPADGLVFDGQRYAGGNLGYIDAMLGKTGRPIALDRALPALLVPLTPEAEAKLTEKRTAFQSSADTRKLREDADQAHGEGAAAGMWADGQFLRPYAGRFDDLYFHLFQNGNGASALAFGALADGLVDRVYQPVNGLRRPGTVPAASFDLDDILSDGGKTAVRSFLSTGSSRAAEPFKRFAFRILPSIVAKVGKLPAGARLIATPEEILRALRTRQHLYPTRVPPLYRSPDRFLGWTGSLFRPAANGPALPPGAADSWYPLPERHGPATTEQAAEGVSSDQLFKSSSASDLVWEDPQLSNLLVDPENRTAAPKLPTGKPAAPASPGAPIPKVESDPRRRPAAPRLIAVITPTTEEARAYRAAMVASDDTLRSIEQTRGRIRLLRQFIESARAVAKETAPAENLPQAVAADLASFERRENELSTKLQDALQERANFRSELAERLHRERVRPWQTGEGRAGEKPRQEGGLAL